MGYNRLSNSSSYKNQNAFNEHFFMKFDIFFTEFESSLKFCKQINYLAFKSTQNQQARYQGNKMC